jgi:hypothetical protein
VTITPEAWLLLAWVLVGAAFLVVHVVVVWLSLRAKALRPATRLLALVPPAAPGVAWVAGRRVAPILWGVLLATYVALRLAE